MYEYTFSFRLHDVKSSSLWKADLKIKDGRREPYDVRYYDAEN